MNTKQSKMSADSGGYLFISPFGAPACFFEAFPEFFVGYAETRKAGSQTAWSNTRSLPIGRALESVYRFGFATGYIAKNFPNRSRFMESRQVRSEAFIDFLGTPWPAKQYRPRLF